MSNVIVTVADVVNILSTDIAYKEWLNTKPDYMRLGILQNRVDDYINAFIEEIYINTENYKFVFSSYNYAIVCTPSSNVEYISTPTWIRDIEGMMYLYDDWKGTVLQMKDLLVKIDEWRLQSENNKQTLLDKITDLRTLKLDNK